MIAEQLAQAHARIAELERELLETQRTLRRTQNGLDIAMTENDHLKTKLYGKRARHPDATVCQCEECNELARTA